MFEQGQSWTIFTCSFEHCLAGHRLRAVDIKVMYELGQYVPLVPVITKADTMTIRESNTYRNDVATKLSNPMVRLLCSECVGSEY